MARSPSTGGASSSWTSVSWTEPRTSCSTATWDVPRRTWRSPRVCWRARDENRLDAELRAIGRARLLVIDELGYLPIDIDAARLLFQVVADSCEKRSVVFTTNLEFGRWGEVLGDGDMAAAVIDRIVHHGKIVRFRGESYSNSHSLMR